MKYRILSLDGGGSWALIQARVLMDIYGDIRGHELLRKFDMAIANSGGSLVLACLCNDMLLSEIVAVFRTESQRKQVFSALSFWEKLQWRNIASLFTRRLGPRYHTERKVKGLKSVLKEMDHLLKEGKIAEPIVETQLHKLPAIIGKPELQLLIVGFDYFKERVNFFRSNTKSLTDNFGSGDFFSTSLADAIHSSSNAPVNYFDQPAQISIHNIAKKDDRQTWYWDGGVSGFNNPVLAGVIEAITNDKGQRKPEDYCILSIGTGVGSRAVLTDMKDSTDPEVKAVYEKNKNNPYAITDTGSGFIKDITKLSTSILSDPPDSATFIAYSILHPALTKDANIIRINPCLSPVKNKETGIYEPPEVYKNNGDKHKLYMDVLELDMDAVADNEVELINDLCNRFIITGSTPALPNQLIRGNISGNYLGHPTYEKAKEKWVKDCM
ncbi:MAG: hypothetical protein HOP10_09185 [Chitinophagaceae bacterium]|nr:hypothetical protein [Chitinophagaceae bacterium]